MSVSRALKYLFNMKRSRQNKEPCGPSVTAESAEDALCPTLQQSSPPEPGNSFPTYATTSGPTGGGVLCDQCQRHKVDDLLAELKSLKMGNPLSVDTENRMATWANENAENISDPSVIIRGSAMLVDLGTALDIKTRKHCPFCRVVGGALIPELFHEPHMNTHIFVQLGKDSIPPVINTKTLYEDYREGEDDSLQLYITVNRHEHWKLGCILFSLPTQKREYLPDPEWQRDELGDKFSRQENRVDSDLTRLLEWLDGSFKEQKAQDALQVFQKYLLDTLLDRTLKREEFAKSVEDALETFYGEDEQDTFAVSDPRVENLIDLANKIRADRRITNLSATTQPTLPALLIDLDLNRLVKANGDERYCTLSYVWGKAHVLKTMEADVTSLMESDSLRNRTDIPQVICDAMTFTRRLQIRYLWVDALCIIQDDTSGSKAYQIANMDTIFRDSYVTIVAWTAKDASMSLPGVSTPLPPQTVCAVANGILLENRVSRDVPFLEEFANISHYQTRGWTFQERLLANRCLFFHHRETLLSIKKHPIEGINCLGMSNNIHFNSMEPKRHGLSDKNIASVFGSKATVPQLIRYVDLMQTYTKLNLTDPCDRINAFRGILAHLKKEIGPCVQGLPIASSPMCLAWIGESFHRNERFASWSWAGWEGAIDCIFCFIDWTEPQITEIRGSAGHDQREWTIWPSTESHDEPSDIVPYDTIRILHFSAPVIAVDIGNPQHKKLLDELQAQEGHSYDPSNCEFVILSRGKGKEQPKTFSMLIRWVDEYAVRVGVICENDTERKDSVTCVKDIHLK